MKHLTIRNFGPLKDVDIDLGRINLIIGLQGSGKSCVMITACYCTWVEKRISLRQSAKEFEQGTSFLDTMTTYYRTKAMCMRIPILAMRRNSWNSATTIAWRVSSTNGKACGGDISVLRCRMCQQSGIWCRWWQTGTGWDKLWQHSGLQGRLGYG